MNTGTLGNCRNCGAMLTGRYCAVCSQAADVHVPSTRELVHDALEGLTHSDSRLWSTLHLLWFKPGALTQAYVAGRRVSYLPPIRLYLVVSVIFFLVASVSHPPSRFVVFDPTNTRDGTVTSVCTDLHLTLFGRDYGPRLSHACSEIARDKGANLLHQSIGILPKAMFLFLPLIALLHMLMYWRPRHRYAEHLLFFVHLHAFFFSVMTLLVLSADAASAWPKLAPLSSLGRLLMWSLPVYTAVALKRVFTRSWPGTLAKLLALFLVYWVVLGVTLAAVFVYAGLQL
jgi:hypothetical protein